MLHRGCSQDRPSLVFSRGFGRPRTHRLSLRQPLSLRSANADADVIRASVSDPEQFALVFERHHRVLMAYLTRRVGPALAADIASETFLVAFRRRHKFDTTHESARPWLFGIASNLLRRHRRREVRELRAYARTGSDPVLSETQAVEDRIDAQRAERQLAAALSALSHLQREVLLLTAWAGLSPEEIARALDVPVGIVRSRLHRARRKMAKRMSSFGQSEGASGISERTRDAE